VFVLGIARNAFEADENIFETGEVAAGDSNAAESFEEGGEEGASFGAFFFGEGGESALAEFFRNLIGQRDSRIGVSSPSPAATMRRVLESTCSRRRA